MGLVVSTPVAFLGASAKGKLAHKYYGPYKIVAKVDSVAYRMELPSHARIHDVFHVGLLKKFHGQSPNSPPSLPDLHHGRVVPAPEAVRQARLAHGVWQVLVHWRGQPASEATWEDVSSFKRCYPAARG